MELNRKKMGTALIVTVGIISATVLLWHSPIAQDPEYHIFRDQRLILGIPNFFNVVTNIPFLVVGIMGLFWLTRSSDENVIREMYVSYVMLFVGVSLVAIGSGYYHLWPSNETLVWDRLPMTLSFMSLFSIIIGEYMSTRFNKPLLFMLIAFGLVSVFYWYYTETIHSGDLRLYVLVQFLPILLIPMILVLFKPSFTLAGGYWLLIAAYLIAKVFELYDSAIFNSGSLVSGHSLKHLAAALGLLLLIKSFDQRTKAK